jgi:hypothetical protein
MATKFRKSPPICLLISLIGLIFGRIKYSKEFVETTVEMENGEEYKIFRYIKFYHQNNNEQGAIFTVRFKFARLSHKINKFISQLPMLLITGFPGFRAKMYAVNEQTGYWQGIYQWESKKALEEYKKSFVLKVMNKRAMNDTVKYDELDKHSLNKYIEKNKK